jgi:hypothetical protein
MSWGHLLSKDGIITFRLLGGVTSLVFGLVLLIRGIGEKPLAIALTALGAFILFHAIVEYSYHAIVGGMYGTADEAGLREFASTFIATSGVILGLLAVFGDTMPKSPLTIKVGVGALVTDILIGTVLVGLLLAPAAPGNQRALNLIRYVFNVALWGLSLGLLCISLALIYR